MLVPQAIQCACRTAKSAHPAASATIKDIYNAEDIDKAQIAVKSFEVDLGAKYPKAVAEIVDDVDTLLEFYKYPAEHWIHLRTTNPIESTFATVRLRTKVTNGPGSRVAGIAMAYKLIDAAQAAGAPSTHRTSSPWCAPAPSSTKANCSNGPPTSHHRYHRQTVADTSERKSPGTHSGTSGSAAERRVLFARKLARAVRNTNEGLTRRVGGSTRPETLKNCVSTAVSDAQADSIQSP